MDINSFRFSLPNSTDTWDCTGISPKINVFFGPNGSGKTALSRLICATIAGLDFSDAEFPLLYDGAKYDGGARHDGASPRGQVSISTPIGTREFTRDFSDRNSRLRIHNDRGIEITTQEIPAIFGNSHPSHWSHAFWLRIDRPGQLASLIQQALDNGLELHESLEKSAHYRELQASLRQQRELLAALPHESSVDVVTWKDRQRKLQLEIDDLELACESRSDSAEFRDRVAERIRDADQRIEELTSALNSLEIDVRNRRLQIGNEVTDPVSADADSRELREIEVQLVRWRQMLQELEQRRAAAEVRRDSHSHQLPIDRDNHRVVLRRIEDQVGTLQNELVGWSDSLADRKLNELRETCTSTLQSLRADVYHLCRELSVWESAVGHWEAANECDRFRSCEQELRLAIDILARQRREILTKISKRLTDHELLHEDLAAFCHCKDHATWPTRVLEADMVCSRSVDGERLSRQEQEYRRLQRELADVRTQRASYEDELRQYRGIPLDAGVLDRKRAELAALNESLRLAERYATIRAAIRRLEDELKSLTSREHTPAIVSQATKIVRRLTREMLTRVEVDTDRTIWVTDRNGLRRSVQQLGSGEHDQVYLSLALAICGAWNRRGVAPPLIVDDVFVHLDTEGVRAAMDVLADPATNGQQTLIFTRNAQVVEALARCGATLFDLTQAPLRPATFDSAIETPRPVTVEVSKTPLIPLVDDTSREFFLCESDPIEEAPTIDRVNADRLRKLGVTTIADLLRIDPAQVAAQLRTVSITAPMLECWQDESRLVCRVPRLRPYDARILVACGIRLPADLMNVSADELRRRVEAFARTPAGRTLMHAGTDLEFSRLFRWMDSQKTQRPSYYARVDHPHGLADLGLGLAGESIGRTLRDRSDQDHDSTVREPIRERASKKTPNRTSNGLRYFLGNSDDVEKAPSIGPRVATTLHAIGIRTIRELLNCDPAKAADQLGNKKVKGETIRVWQQQAELVCRIPELRGHDAQVLVACGITKPEQLSGVSPQELVSKITTFAQSSEGKRVLRGSEPPDDHEIASWIEWARESRSLQAA